jgi:hypothetical protein
MSEPGRADAGGGHPAEVSDPRSGTAPADLGGRPPGGREGTTEHVAGSGGPAETRDDPEPGDAYVPV